MANTTVIPALVPQIWQKQLHKDVIDNLFFSNKNMMGKDTNNVIQIKDELKKDQGDRVTFGLTAKLGNRPITGDNEAEGNEEAISGYSQSVLIDQARFPVRLQGKLTEQKAAYDMRMDAKEKLAIRLSEFIERQIFMKMAGVTSTDLTDVNGSVYSEDAAWSNSAPIVPAADEAAGTGDRYICADADGLDSLQATDVFSLSLITKAKIKALTASGPKLQPLKINGQNFWVMFLHPWQEADLKNSTSGINWNQIQREAQVRGDKNPIFSGALGVYDGVILHSHEYVSVCQSGANFSTSGTAAGAQAFRATLCGRQSLAFAETQDSTDFNEVLRDLNNKVVYSSGIIGGIQKTAFNSKDYGVITVDTGATNLA